MRITKSVKKQLHTVLCLDDVLFEQHRRLSEDIQRQTKRYLHDRKRVNKVISVGKDGTRHVLPISNVYVTDEGTIIEVEKE